MKKFILVVFGIFVTSFIGCDYFENSDTLNSSSLEINVTGLPALADTMTYVVWVENENPANLRPYIIHTSDAVNGSITFKSEKPLRILQTSQIIWLSVERKDVLSDSVFTPSTRRIFSGRFVKGGCNLGIGEEVYNFENTSAVFRLLTPTDGSGTNETSGIWFVNLDSVGAFKAGLDLPDLYQGWIYEGWVEVNGTFLSTGRFSTPAGADLRKQYGSSGAGLNFPGEDFLVNAPSGLTFPLDLAGKKAHISLEINDGRNAGVQPAIVLYSFDIPAAAQTNFTYQMVKLNTPVPSGDAVISIDLVK